MKTDFVNKMSRSFHKVGFKFKKHSPEILVVTGVIGTVASAVMACKATLKVNDVIDEAKETVDKIHECVGQNLHTSDGEEYTQEVANKDLAITYVQTGWKLTKLYGPAILLGVASIGCMVGSNQILRKRNIALGAAFKAVDTSFKEYRGRLIDRFGKELDRELRFGTTTKEVEEQVIDENGNETTVTKAVEVVDPNAAHSIYSVVFYEGNTGWTKNAELNKVFLIQQQNYANDKLRLNGILTLNEVYDMLGVARTAYGQIAGWVYTEDSSVGDNFVDFGIFDPDDTTKCNFINGSERSIILDFNCIGNILDYI
jgi:hypothetical protein